MLPLPMLPPLRPSLSTGHVRLPYRVGEKFHCLPHVAKEPICDHKIFYHLRFNHETLRARNTLSILYRYQLYQLEPDRLEPADKGISLSITETLQVGESEGAQVVEAQVDDIHELNSDYKSLVKGDVVVMKFFDPVYFDHFDQIYDPFLWMENGYRTESKAYKMLSACDETALLRAVPVSYGSFTCRVESELGLRTVYLILMEKINGDAMNTLSWYDFMREDRERIVGNLLDTEARLRCAGIAHRNLRPRNVILSDHFPPNNYPVFLDFGRVTFKSICESTTSFLEKREASFFTRFDGFEAWIDWNLEECVEARHIARYKEDIEEKKESNSDS